MNELTKFNYSFLYDLYLTTNLISIIKLNVPLNEMVFYFDLALYANTNKESCISNKSREWLILSTIRNDK